MVSPGRRPDRSASEPSSMREMYTPRPASFPPLTHIPKPCESCWSRDIATVRVDSSWTFGTFRSLSLLSLSLSRSRSRIAYRYYKTEKRIKHHIIYIPYNMVYAIRYTAYQPINKILIILNLVYALLLPGSICNYAQLICSQTFSIAFSFRKLCLRSFLKSLFVRQE